MKPLEEGDRVLCVDDDNGDLESIVAGKSYTITAITVDRDGDEFVSVDGDAPAWLSCRFVLAEPAPYAIPVAAHEPPTDALRAAYEFYRRNVGDQAEQRRDPWRNFVPAGMEPPFAVEQPKAMLPERDDPYLEYLRQGFEAATGFSGHWEFTEDYYLNFAGKTHSGTGRTYNPLTRAEWTKPPLADPSDPVPVRFSEVATDEPDTSGIARAVANLSAREPRLGAARYSPEDN